MDFKTMIGQDNTIAMLKGDIANNSISHAYVFWGPQGVGKLSMATAFAKAINCNSGSYGCDNCNSCIKMKNSNHPDIKVIKAQTSSIGIDIIRDEIQKDINILPYLGGKKVYIIDGADTMTPQAQNCLLKTLEEPPKSVVIILLCEALHSLLPTVVSRCQRFEIKKLSPSLLQHYLEKSYQMSPEEVKAVIAFSQGVIGRAKDYVEQEKFQILREEVLKIIQGIVSKDSFTLISSVGFFEENKDNIDTVLDILISYFRDINIYIITAEQQRIINRDKADTIISLAKGLNSKQLVDIIDIIEKTKNNQRYNSNYQLNIEVMLLDIQEGLR